MPDRLPSLIVLVAFWIPPAVAGWVAAGSLLRSTRPDRSGVTYATLSTLVVAYAAAWYFFNLGRMPPYIPGATMDPTEATPRAAANLALFTGAMILPGSAIACAVAFRRRLRTMRGAIRQV